MLKQEIRRVLHSPFFYISIIILVFADFPVMLDQFEMSNELTYLVDVGWGMGYGSVLYPLLCVLTTAESTDIPLCPEQVRRDMRLLRW